MKWLRLPTFILISFSLGLYLEFWRRLPGFSILGHSYEWKWNQLTIAAIILFPLILAFWSGYSGFLSRALKEKYSFVLKRDALTYLPIVLFALTPLTLRHYLVREDLASRLFLLMAAVASAVVYLKAVQAYRWVRARPASGQALIDRFGALPRGKRLFVLLAIALVLYNAGSLIMSSKGVYFSGDEPHYLIITHSLLRDGDVEVSNNYAQKDFERYLPAGSPLIPHVIKRGEVSPHYSFHSPGISVLMLPFYALGLLLGKAGLILIVRFGMSLFGALFGLQIYLFARQEWGRERLALGLWALAGFTSPVYFYSVHVYPEIVVAFLGLLLFRLIRFAESFSARRLLAAGFLFSTFVWFHAIKYPLILAPLFLYFLSVLIKRYCVRAQLAYFFAAPVVLTVLYLIFQYAHYGSLSPSAISWRGAMTGSESASFLKFIFGDIPFRYRWETLAGYFLDQRDGLLLYAPIYLFAFLGLVEMWRRTRKDLFVLLLITAPYVLVQAFLTQRTGFAPQARPMVAVIWGMILLLGTFLAHNGKKFFSAIAAVAGLSSLLVVGLLLLYPWSLYQETTQGTVERGGALFYQLSSLHHSVTRVLPSFLKIEGAWWPNNVWLGGLALLVLAYVLWKGREFRPRFGAHVFIAFVAAGFAAFWFAYYPRVVLIKPVGVDFPLRGTLGFYNLSRVARMGEPGRFHLLEDDRSYNFYFTSRLPMKELGLEIGSKKGVYAAALSLFDVRFFADRTRREIRPLSYADPPFYRLKNAHLYRLSIILRRKSTVSTVENPYLLALQPSF